MRLFLRELRTVSSHVICWSRKEKRSRREVECSEDFFRLHAGKPLRRPLKSGKYGFRTENGLA